MVKQEFEPLISVPKLARKMGCGPETVYNLINQGRLRAINLNGPDALKRNWRVPLSAWEEFVNGKEVH